MTARTDSAALEEARKIATTQRLKSALAGLFSATLYLDTKPERFKEATAEIIAAAKAEAVEPLKAEIARLRGLHGPPSRRAVTEMSDDELRAESRSTLSRVTQQLRTPRHADTAEFLGRGFEVDAEIRRRAAEARSDD